MSIVNQKWEFLNRTLEYVPAKVQDLFKFGLEAYAARPVGSLRTNARCVRYNIKTAKTKAYRLSKSNTIAARFPWLITALGMVRGTDTVAVDFSDFGCGFQVLLFAVRTKRGRAIPVYFEILRYPIPEGSQNLFVVNAIERFDRWCGCSPHLVFDRGFAAPHIITPLAQRSGKFYVRVKGGTHFTAVETHRTAPARGYRKKDTRVYAYGGIRRLVVSDTHPRCSEPWYIITNDMRCKRDTVVTIYYHRFEIEEFFRDAKHVMALEHVRYDSERTLTNLLWFVVIGMWCLWHLEETAVTYRDLISDYLEEGLSIIRAWFEYLTSVLIREAEGTYLTAGKPG